MSEQTAYVLGSEDAEIADRAGRPLEVAEQRRAAAGADAIRFVQADVREFTASEPFDAIVARLLLFHLPDREAVVRRQLDALRPGGTMVVIDPDMGTVRTEPHVPLVKRVRAWIEAPPQIVAEGIADKAELDLETLEARIAEQVAAHDAVILPPALVGAWGTRPAHADA